MVLTRRIFALLEEDPQAAVNEINKVKDKTAHSNPQRRSMGKYSWVKNILVNADWMRTVNKQVATAL
jgi:hypothetical protein